MRELHIRRAEAGDFLQISALLAELGRPPLTAETTDIVRTLFLRHVAEEHTASLAAEVEGAIVGFLSLVFREHLNYVHPQAWIPDLIVTEAARGHGIARALLERAFAEAKAQGCDWVRLESGYTRTAAHKAYEAVGMSNDGYYFTRTL